MTTSFDLFPAPTVPLQRNTDLGQWMTPDWAAQVLVDQFFPHLTAQDAVLEPTCGRGAFLRAIPDYVPAFGVEIDPALAAVARETSGRQIIVGDIRTVDLPVRPTAVIGNPPFQLNVIEDILDRCWDLLPEEGQAGLLVPAYVFQTPSTVERLSARWSAQQSMIPRTLFRGLSMPLCFAMLTKGTRRSWVGFALYHEALAVERLQARYRALLTEGVGSVWEAVTRAALEALGGRATLQAIYREVEGARPTTNRFWQAKIRQQLQRFAVRVGQGEWALPAHTEQVA